MGSFLDCQAFYLWHETLFYTTVGRRWQGRPTDEFPTNGSLDSQQAFIRVSLSTMLAEL